MKSNILTFIILAFLVLLLLGAWGLWQFHISSKRDLEQSMRQYGETMSQIEKYAALRKTPSRQKNTPQASLFAQINQLGVEFGLSRRMENLRPSGDAQKGRESLDLQVKSLYLAEFAGFLQAVEALDQVSIDRMSLVRSADRHLDLEMRLSRSAPGS